MNIQIKNGRVIDPANALDKVTDLYIQDNKIASLTEAPVGFQAASVIDANNCIVCPGLVDIRARLREPGQEHKGTIESETLAAAHGGVTTLCMPPDTDPIIDTPAVVDLIQHRVLSAGNCNVVCLGALTIALEGHQLSEIARLKQAGCVGVTNAYHYISNAQVMRRAMEYVASLDMTIFLHAQDQSLGGGCAHEGEISTRLGLEGIPESAETIAVSRDLMLIEQTGVRAHFCQLSTERAVKMIARAQYDGLRVTTDVAVHHLHLTDMDIGYFNSLCHVSPPVRSRRDLEGLRNSVCNGVLTTICSDHQPHDVDAKLAPFPQTEPGISSIETLLPLSLRLVEETELGMSEMLAKLTSKPAGILNIDAGTLSAGSQADVCIFDPESYWTVTEQNLQSHGKNSPFIGWDMKGKVMYTIVGGELVYQFNHQGV